MVAATVPQHRLQPTLSVWLILALGGMSRTVASAMFILASRARLMASRWAVQAGTIVW